MDITSISHDYGKQTRLTEKFEQIETPPQIKKYVELYEHQKTIVAAMLKVEDKRFLKVRLGETVKGFLQSSAMVLNEKYGSGKTLMILTLIIMRPIPKAYPIVHNLPTINANTRRDYHYKTQLGTPSINSVRIEMKYSPDKLIKPNLIVVGSPVLVQWENAIKRFTDLKICSVVNYYDMLKFQRLHKSGDLKIFDIVLLKNGKIMGSIDYGDGEEEKTADSTLNIIQRITRGYFWSRVIYDDFDTINIPPNTRIMNTLFTLYVSATTKDQRVNGFVKSKNTYSSVLNLVKDNSIELKDMFHDSGMSCFSMCATTSYTESSTNLPIITKHLCVYDNPNDNVIRLAGALNDEEAREIVEMLNSDAPDTAAQRLGIKSNSPADIFKKMLGNKYERVMKDTKIVDTTEDTIELHNNLDPHERKKKYSEKKMEKVTEAITKCNVPKLKYYAENLTYHLDDIRLQYTQSRNANRLAIDRVVDNIKEGDCQICQVPLEGESAFIVKCCGLIVCGDCGIKGNQIKNRYDPRSGKYGVYGQCANCKKNVYPSTDLIFVDQEFDMDALVNAKGDEEPEAEIVEEEIDSDAEPEDTTSLDYRIKHIENPKHRAIVQICLGIEPSNCTIVNTQIKGLIEGKVDRPAPKDKKLKILLFAPYAETIEGIQKTLTEFGIGYINMHGTSREKGEHVLNYARGDETVLLANSKQDCAGLDLQMSDCVVYYNKITDPDVEGQIAGRISRMGRLYNGKIIYLQYRNESSENYGT